MVHLGALIRQDNSRPDLIGIRDNPFGSGAEPLDQPMGLEAARQALAAARVSRQSIPDTLAISLSDSISYK